MKITVFTPTYNRAYIIENLYRSLQRQTFRDFEWLVVDDGSSDNTQEVFAAWMQDNNGFPIRYYRQENRGKCQAINYGLTLATGELFFNVDSDDYLTDDALEKISLWESTLPKDQKFCGFAGNLGFSPTETPNTAFDGDFVEGTALDRYTLVDGERAMVFYTEVHRQYPYPHFPGEKFMTEAVVWNRMANDGYKMRFYNDIIWIYEYLEDGLTKSGSSVFLRNPQGAGLWLREKSKFTGDSFKERMRMWYTYYCDHTACEKEYRLTAKQCAKYIGAPLLFIYLSAAVHKLSNFAKKLLGK